MRLGLCLVCVSFALACARPSLDENADGGDSDGEDAARLTGDAAADANTPPDHDSGSTPDAESPPGDAGTADGAVRDASVPDTGTHDGGSRPDAGCSDGDSDGVCDMTDNCPSVSNPDQADSNNDGVGNACMAAGGSCSDVQLDPGVLGSVVASQTLSVNGGSGTLQVKAGAQVSGTIRVQFNTCGAQTLFMGVETEASSCQTNVCLFGTPPPATFSFAFKAPSTPGLYYVLAGVSQPSPAYCPAGTILPAAGAAGTKKVAALCVTE